MNMANISYKTNILEKIKDKKRKKLIFRLT